MQLLTIMFLVMLGCSLGIQLWLDRRQVNHVRSRRNLVPEAFSSMISLDAHQKAADYTIAKNRLNQLSQVVSALLLLYFTLGGGINTLAEAWSSLSAEPILTGTLLILSVFLIVHLVDLPFILYQTFVVESHFGFNRNTLGQFARDQLLQLILAGTIGGLLIAAILWVMQNSSGLWWLIAWSMIIGFSLLMSWAYPTFIAPLFNTFTPLEDQALKQRIESLLARCGFHSKGVFVMDGSRRSGHGNAYFTGIGNNKRIVFFDTLINNLEEDELEAVLAHELGHFKRRHVIKMLVTNAIVTLVSFALLGWLAGHDWFYSAFNVADNSPASALLLFFLVSPVFGFFLQPVMAHFQRRFEFEADDFASKHSRAAYLVSALVKLYRDNASTLTPDPWYSAYHHSHPPASARIANLTSS